MTHFIDSKFDKNRLKKLIFWTFEIYGWKKTLQVSDYIKDIGFRIASKSGLSLGSEDLLIQKKKRWVNRINENESKIYKYRKENGSGTSRETNKYFVKMWALTSELLKEEISNRFHQHDPYNPLFLIFFGSSWKSDPSTTDN